MLTSEKVDYLLVGGYAVGYYGYPRATGDMDIWVRQEPENAEKLVRVLQKFGYAVENLTAELFLQENKVVRMGNPPLRIDVLMSVDGVEFSECHAKRTSATIDEVAIDIISLDHLRNNKKASGRAKDLDDLEHLPEKD